MSYVGNLAEFLGSSNGYGVLVDRPWNRETRSALENWLHEERCFVVERLDEVAPLVERLAASFE